MITCMTEPKLLGLLLELPLSIRKKFARPKVKSKTYKYLGQTEIQLLAVGVSYISLAIEDARTGPTYHNQAFLKDYKKWVGLTKKDVHAILDGMLNRDWKPGDVIF